MELSVEQQRALVADLDARLRREAELEGALRAVSLPLGAARTAAGDAELHALVATSRAKPGALVASVCAAY